MGRDTCGPWSTLANEFHANARCLGFWRECRFSSLHGRWAAGAGLGMSANARSSGNTCVQNVKESRSELRTHKHGQGETTLAVKAIGGRESSEPMSLWDYEINHVTSKNPYGQTTFCYFQVYGIPYCIGTTWDKQHGVIWQYRVAQELGSTQVLQPLLRTGRDKEDHRTWAFLGDAVASHT